MPLKWKIFLGLNFLLSLPALIYFILFLIDFLNSYSRQRFYVIAFAFMFGLLVITVNGFLNIYILQRFFPDKLLPPGVKRLNSISLVVNSVASVALLLLCIYGAKEEFGADREDESSRGKIAVFSFFFMWLTQVIVLIMQGQLPGTISRNNRESMDSLIDSIGQQ